MNVVCWCILACFHAIIVGFGQSPYINFKPRGWPIWSISVCTKDISCYEIFPIMDFKKNMRISGMLKIDQHLWYPSWNLASSQAVAWTWLLTSWPESFNHFRCRQRKHHPRQAFGHKTWRYGFQTDSNWKNESKLQKFKATLETETNIF